MDDLVEKAKLYRMKAAELRERAKQLSDFNAREGTLSAALSYESLAASLDRIKESKLLLTDRDSKL